MDYSSFANLAQSLLDGYGTPLTILRRSASAFDPESGTYGTTADSTLTTSATVRSSSPRADGFAAGGLIARSDRVFTIPARDLAFTPRSGDLVAYGDTKYTVDFVEPLAPGGVTILLKLSCTRG